MVTSECIDGDLAAAQERLQLLDGSELLAPFEEVDALALSLIDNDAVPAAETRDAFRIAIAAVNGVQSIVTRNFKQILNSTLPGKIALVCRECG